MADRTTALSRQPRRTWLLGLWLVLTAAFPGMLANLARRAHVRHAADPARLAERLGQPGLPRPDGQLIWLHAASVGEVNSVLRLAAAIAAQDGTRLLVTTSTATGAARVAEQLPQALHQFLPIDNPMAVDGFLTHWHPDAALFVEGDLWPRMILALAGRGVPMALINARASRSRQRFRRSFAALLSPMALVTAQDDTVAQGLRALGLNPAVIQTPGNLKADIAPPAVTESLRSTILEAAQGRRLWAAVSTHPGEEAIVLDAQARLRGDPMLLLVPRHPDRGAAIAAELARRYLRVARHGLGERPDGRTQVYLLDTMGETGTVFAAARLALVGGSLVTGPGGHTPYEPAALGCAILTGPHHANFADAYRSFATCGGARVVTDANSLAAALETLWSVPKDWAVMQAAARDEQARQAGATARTLELLAPILAHRHA